MPNDPAPTGGTEPVAPLAHPAMLTTSDITEAAREAKRAIVDRGGALIYEIDGVIVTLRPGDPG